MASKPPSFGRAPIDAKPGSAGYYKVTDGLKMPSGGPTIGPLPEGVFRYRSDIEKSGQSSGISGTQITAFFKMLEENKGPLKTTLAIIKTSDNAIKFAKFCFQLERWGFSVAEIVQVLVLAGSLQSSKFLSFMEYVLRNGDRLSKFFAKTKGARNGLGYLLLAVTVYSSLADKNYGEAASKTYRFVMGKAIPWAGAIDTLQGLMPESSPASRTFFKILRAFDPIGLGGGGVEAMVFLVQSLIDAIGGKDFDEERLNKLANRLKKGPTSFFYELGEKLPIGEIVFDLKELAVEKWRAMGQLSDKDLRNVLRNWKG